MKMDENATFVIDQPDLVRGEAGDRRPSDNPEVQGNRDSKVLAESSASEIVEQRRKKRERSGTRRRKTAWKRQGRAGRSDWRRRESAEKKNAEKSSIERQLERERDEEGPNLEGRKEERRTESVNRRRFRPGFGDLISKAASTADGRRRLVGVLRIGVGVGAVK